MATRDEKFNAGGFSARMTFADFSITFGGNDVAFSVTGDDELVKLLSFRIEDDLVCMEGRIPGVDSEDVIYSTSYSNGVFKINNVPLKNELRLKVKLNLPVNSTLVIGEHCFGIVSLLNDGNDVIIENQSMSDISAKSFANLSTDLLSSGDLSFIEVLRSLRINLRGSGDAAGESISGSLNLKSSGSGGLKIKEVSLKTADITMSGSGDVAFESGLIEKLSLSNFGSGELSARDILADSTITLTGSGDASFKSIKGRLSHSGSGSGDLNVEMVCLVSSSIDLSGNGDVDFESGTIDTLEVETSGSGEFTFDGPVGTGSFKSSGSGDITVGPCKRILRSKCSGSGDINIGED